MPRQPAASQIEERFARNLDWNLLYTFHVIVQSGNLTRAAEKLGRKQPAISLALRRLEGHMGASLCERGSNRFELTPEGMIVAKICQDLFVQVRALPDRLARLPGEVVGHLRIVAVSSITSPFLDRALAAFHRQCPRVQIEIEIVAWEDVTRYLTRQIADIGIGPARFIDAEYRYCLLYSEPVRLYCGKTHPLHGRHIRRPSDLADEGIILTGGDEPDIISRYRLEHGLGRVVAGQSEHLDEAKRLTMQGIGICFLPEPFVRNEVTWGQLWALLPRNESFSSDIYVITLPLERAQLPTRLFLDVLNAMKKPKQPAGWCDYRKPHPG